MKYTIAREAFEAFSGSASSIVRQLGFAGVGIVWVFSSHTAAGFSVPNGLVFPTILIVIGLGLDLLQCAWATASWHIFITREWKRIPNEDAEVRPWKAINWPTTSLFWLKHAAIVWAYVRLGIYLFGIMNAPIPASPR